ncbi:genetic competence negative regulator [Halalkalibacterium ligniniphilum]|uniref:genetic competence negative regulator n=1 Tax=Halalkalibacterium ligniniphilum TaxID=1134413 RepID=UPI00034AB58D|nr:genetic competence negative regulator [Halalkalibacterium ligniniphilum]
MRLERLNINKIKVFLTFDDLQERGITKEDLWQDIPKVHDLFRDMMLEADDELGFKADGPIAVEVFALPAQGMVIIVTKGTTEFDEDSFEEGYIEMQVTLDESDEVFYEFAELEDVIALSSRLFPFGVTGGVLYHFENKYYVKFEDEDLEEIEEQAFISLLAEFGNPSTISTYRVGEYGKCLMESQAIHRLFETFIKR